MADPEGEGFRWPHFGPYQHLADRLDAIEEKLETIMSALTDLQAADTALQAEVATFLTDIATRLANSPDPVAVEAVVTDINAEIAGLMAGDPVTPPPAPTPPAGP